MLKDGWVYFPCKMYVEVTPILITEIKHSAFFYFEKVKNNQHNCLLISVSDLYVYLLLPNIAITEEKCHKACYYHVPGCVGYLLLIPIPRKANVYILKKVPIKH